MSLASLNRHMRGIELTPEDEGILAFLDLSDYARYELSIADRNDAAVSSTAAKTCAVKVALSGVSAKERNAVSRSSRTVARLDPLVPSLSMAPMASPRLSMYEATTCASLSDDPALTTDLIKLLVAVDETLLIVTPVP